MLLAADTLDQQQIGMEIGERGRGTTPRGGMGDEKAKETPGLILGPLSTALHSSLTHLLSY
jgi:hypothetical protein